MNCYIIFLGHQIKLSNWWFNETFGGRIIWTKNRGSAPHPFNTTFRYSYTTLWNTLIFRGKNRFPSFSPISQWTCKNNNEKGSLLPFSLNNYWHKYICCSWVTLCPVRCTSASFYSSATWERRSWGVICCHTCHCVWNSLELSSSPSWYYSGVTAVFVH